MIADGSWLPTPFAMTIIINDDNSNDDNKDKNDNDNNNKEFEDGHHINRI